jgi:hypothetical protein
MNQFINTIDFNFMGIITIHIKLQFVKQMIIIYLL